MKKSAVLTLIVCVALALCASVIPAATASAAEPETDPTDVAFAEAFGTLAGETYAAPVDAVCDRTPLYDIDLKPLGALYTFELYGEKGYAAVVNVEADIYEVTEMFFGAEAPYPFNEGDLNVYVRPMSYLVYNDGYLNAETGAEISAETIAALRDEAFYGSDGTLSSTHETIYYTDKSQNTHSLATRNPSIVELPAYSYECVCVAGANVIQYYDRNYPNLIANYTPGMGLGTRYMYATPGSQTTALVGQLYSAMGTNTTGSGTTVSQFRNGMTSYVTGAGYSISYTSLMSGTSFNYQAAKTQLESSRPLVIFTEAVDVTVISTGSGSDSVTDYHGAGRHAMAVFGYNEITYTMSDGSVRNVNYLLVAPGLESISAGYYNVSTGGIEDALAIVIS